MTNRSDLVGYTLNGKKRNFDMVQQVFAIEID